MMARLLYGQLSTAGGSVMPSSTGSTATMQRTAASGDFCIACQDFSVASDDFGVTGQDFKVASHDNGVAC